MNTTFFRLLLLISGILLLTGMTGDDVTLFQPLVQTAVGGLSAWLGSRSGVSEVKRMLRAHMDETWAQAHKKGSTND